MLSPLGLHVTLLIVFKGAFDSKGSQVLPDKSSFGYILLCDGPKKGGTCDVSSWDAFYLALFWALNSVAWFLLIFIGTSLYRTLSPLLLHFLVTIYLISHLISPQRLF